MSSNQISEIQAQAQQAVGRATTTDELEEARIQYLGRKAELPQLLRSVAQLEPKERGVVGKAANVARQAIEAAFNARMEALQEQELQQQLVAQRIDVTLPGSPELPPGRLHLLTTTQREIEDIFVGLGFAVLRGPEVETVHYNFDALNHDPAHPARAKTDTFYVDGQADLLLRTHTSPMQIRAMEAQPPPLYVIVPGRVYRRDSDATHTPQFHQIEGLAVDVGLTFADLKGVLLEFVRAIFGQEREIRLRPHVFPFTEPSVEVDVSCFACASSRSENKRCSLCKGTGWLEILGAGMVDPNVLKAVGSPAYDPENVTGFAWGMGVERIAMLKHGIPDLRLFYDNDLRFLEQFG